MDQNRFWNLLAKKLAGESTEQENFELEELIKSNPEASFAAQHVSDLWKLKTKENKSEAEASFQHLLSKIDEPSHFTSNHYNEADEFAAAAPAKKRYGTVFLFLMAAIISAAGVYYYNLSGKKPALEKLGPTAEVYALPGSRRKMVLPDSSVVWLNAGSKLSYVQPFGDKERVVTLTGEAFFDVVKSSKPFIIHTSDVQIKVLGTAFNVRNYPNEKKIETSLVRGRVEITLDKTPEKKYVLYPNEKLTLNTGEESEKTGLRKSRLPQAVESTLHYYDSSTIVETSWIENKLVFSDESFEEVAHKMELWYGVTIIFKSEKLKAERLTGLFEKETVQQALEALKITVPFRFTIKNQEIIITP